VFVAALVPSTELIRRPPARLAFGIRPEAITLEPRPSRGCKVMFVTAYENH
jgi:hypothetical protein